MIIALTFFGCKDVNQTEKGKEPSTHAKWGYSGETGPENWGELEAGADCDGQNQSPVNIVDINTTPRNVINDIEYIRYNEVDTIKSISNNGHTIQYNFNKEDNIVKYEGKEYKLIQFHFHSPAEHTINGVRYPLEIHAVHHCEETNDFIVFAALVQQGQPDSTFTFLEKYLPIRAGETKEINATYSFGSNIHELFGLDAINVYTYNGSLTTPPCTEKVFWVVMKNANSASPEQIELLQTLMPLNNYREGQPLNGRTIHRETVLD